jgi:hypothetical protein
MPAASDPLLIDVSTADARAAGVDVRHSLPVGAKFPGPPRAGVLSPPGGVSIDDIFIFLNLWFAGC